MVAKDIHIKVISSIAESPEDSATNIIARTGVSNSSFYNTLEEIKNKYVDYEIEAEGDSIKKLVEDYGEEVSYVEVQKAINYIQKKGKKLINEKKVMNDTDSTMSIEPERQERSFDIDSTTKALQLVLSKFKTSKISAERIDNIIDLYQVMEHKYKKEPWLLRNLLVQFLGEGAGAEAFSAFIDIVKYYVPPDQGAPYTKPNNNSNNVDPMLMGMMGNREGEINPLALAGGSGNDWLKQLMIADYFEDRRKRRQKEDEERVEKIEERKRQQKRDWEEAENRRMLMMMMFGLNKQGGGNGDIPPGFTIRRTYDPSGKPIDDLVPISQMQGNEGNTEILKTVIQVLGNRNNDTANSFMQSIATTAMNKLNVQTDPLEQAARVMEVVERFKPQTPQEDPYNKVKAEMELMNLKFNQVQKQWEREDRMFDKKMQQENTKGYMDTIERVLTNVGAPLVEKFTSGFGKQQAQPQASYQADGLPPGVSMEDYLRSLPDDKLDEITQMRDRRLVEFGEENSALEKVISERRGKEPKQNKETFKENSNEENTGYGDGEYHFNVR